MQKPLGAFTDYYRIADNHCKQYEWKSVVVQQILGGAGLRRTLCQFLLKAAKLGKNYVFWIIQHFFDKREEPAITP